MSKTFHRLIHQSEVDAIWRLRHEGVGKYQIARMVGISHDTVDDIITWGRTFGAVGFDPVAKQAAIDEAEALIKAGVQHRDAARRVGVSYRDMMSAFNQKYLATKRDPDRASRRSQCTASMFTDEWFAWNNERFVRGMLQAHPEVEDVYRACQAQRARASAKPPARQAVV